MNSPHLFSRWAEFYDRLYARRGKDYAKEAAYLLDLVRDVDHTGARTVLDIACGTGAHLVHLREHFKVEGVDHNAAMLAVAQRRLPGVMLHRQDMTRLDLPRRFDVICCLFGSINYLADEAALASAMRAMARHLKPHGLLLIEPALMPERMKPSATDTMRIDETGLRLTRRTSAKVRGDSLAITFDFDIEIPPNVEPFAEVHHIRLFDRRTCERAIRSASLIVRFDPLGPAGHGLFIATPKAAHGPCASGIKTT